MALRGHAVLRLKKCSKSNKFIPKNNTTDYSERIRILVHYYLIFITAVLITSECVSSHNVSRPNVKRSCRAGVLAKKV